MKGNKQGLLDKNEIYGEKEEYPNYTKKNASQNQADYRLLQDKFDEKDFAKRPPQKSATNHSQAYTQPKPIIYNIQHPQNSILHINSSGVSIQSRTPYFPPIIVDCKKCEMKQQIPANISQFICCGCHQKTKVEPTFGVFICGVCRNHVSYPYRTSDHIQCIYCYTVNKVPLAPVDPSKKEQAKNEPILPKDLRENVELQENQFGQITTARGQQIDEKQEF